MDHQAEAHITGESGTGFRPGVHMQATIAIVVPASASFAPRELKIDISKVSVSPAKRG